MAVLEFRPRFSDRIALAIRQAELTQTQVAERLNVKQATVSRWVNGKVIPDLPTLVELSNITGAEWLLDLREATSISDEGKRRITCYGECAGQTPRNPAAA